VVTPVQSRLDYTQTRDYSVQNFHFQCLKAPGSQNALARIVLPNLRSTPVASLLLRLHWLPVTSRKKIQTGNYYLQISSITNLPASATSAASTRSTTVRVVKCMCVCMEFSSVQFIRCEHGFKCNSGESISAAVFATRSVNDFTPIHGTLGNIKLFFYGGPRCHDSNLLTAQIVTAAYSQQIGLSAFSAFLSSRHNSVLYCFYYIVSVLINKY